MRITPSVHRCLALALFVVTLLCGLSASAATETVLHGFNPYRHGQYPEKGVIADGAGNLYGTTYLGGTYGVGTVYKMIPSASGGWTETVLYNFTGGADGAYPQGGVIVDSHGNLYGTTSVGGSVCSLDQRGCGVVFELTRDGAQYTESVLHTFSGDDGYFPGGSLTFDAKGNLYGSTFGGGDQLGYCQTYGCGVVFELVSAAGSWSFSVLYAFQGGADAGAPNGGLVFDQAGNLYGTSSEGGSASCNFPCGAVFELTPNGSGVWTENILYGFTGDLNGDTPYGPLILDRHGNLYGTTSGGGTWGTGTVFKLTHGKGLWTARIIYGNDFFRTAIGPEGHMILDQLGNLYFAAFGSFGQCYGEVVELTPGNGRWTDTTLHSFAGPDGCAPDDVIMTPDGRIFGTAETDGPFGSGAVFALTSANGLWTESTVAGFLGSDGSFLTGGPIFDSAGNLYGAASAGGNINAGAVFKMTPNSLGGWTEKVIYSWTTALNGGPNGSLVIDPQGNLYGTTTDTVFELTPSGSTWSQSILYSVSYGRFVQTPLILDAAGNIYGTTLQGGFGFGSVFMLSPASRGTWNQTDLYQFSGGVDGRNPLGGVIFDQSGNLYGATGGGGAFSYGTIFKLSPSLSGTWTETVLCSFNNGPNGSSPQGPLALDAAGNLYGTTYPAFNYHGPVSVFQLSPSGVLSFPLTLATGDALNPVILDAAGSLYGTTISGTVFQLTPGSGGWTETMLHSFTGQDGAYPTGSLLRDAAGNLYGSTELGGPVYADVGTVYEITP